MYFECITRLDLIWSIHACTQCSSFCRPLQLSVTLLHIHIIQSCTHWKISVVSGYYANFKSMDLPNIPLQMADSDHARDVSTQRSIHNVVALINGVCVRQKTKQQWAAALHLTHTSEIIGGGLQATKEAGYLQDICTFIGFENGLIRPIPIYLDSQPCITARVNHPSKSPSVTPWWYLGQTNNIRKPFWQNSSQ